MFQWLVNFGQWLFDVVSPILDFFKSTLHGLFLMGKMFPRLIQLASNSIAYLPSIFAVFITVTIIIYVVYMIIGRSAGGSDG